MNTTVVAMPNLLDPMYWLGADGVFGHAVLPGILLIVFVETGLLFPLLPGESLLFTGGLLAASTHPPVSIEVLASCVAVVAVLGDQTGYFIGRRIGPALFKKEDSRFFKQHHVTESHAFFEKYGPMAIIMARFMPFVRTFTPVVAGVSYMRYPVYLAFDVVGPALEIAQTIAVRFTLVVAFASGIPVPLVIHAAGDMRSECVKGLRRRRT